MREIKTKHELREELKSNINAWAYISKEMKHFDLYYYKQYYDYLIAEYPESVKYLPQTLCPQSRNYYYAQAMRYASDELRNNKEFVLSILKDWTISSECLLRYASSKLKNDPEVVLEAIKATSESLFYTNMNLRNNKEFMLEAITNNPSCLKLLTGKLIKDKEFVLEAEKKVKEVRQLYPEPKYYNEEPRDGLQDKEAEIKSAYERRKLYEENNIKLYFPLSKQISRASILENISNKGYEHLSIEEKEYLYQDPPFLFFKRDYEYEEVLGYKLSNKKSFVLEVVRRYGFNLQYVSSRLRNDKEIVLEAISNHKSAVRYASKKIRNDKEVMLKAVSIDGKLLEYASDELRCDKDVVLAAIYNNWKAIYHADYSLRKNLEFMLEAVKLCGEVARVEYFENLEYQKLAGWI